MKTNNWILEGIIFGLIMLVFSSLFDVITDDFNLNNLWLKALVWLIGGLLYGFIMKLIKEKQAKDL